MFIFPGYQFDSQLHVHLNRPSVWFTVMCSSYHVPVCRTFPCSSYQAISLPRSYMFISPGYQFTQSCMFILPDHQLVSRLYFHLTRLLLWLRVICSSYQAVSLSDIFMFVIPSCQFVSVRFSSVQAISLAHSYMFISPGCQFDSQLYVHLTRLSVWLTVTCPYYLAVNLAYSFLFILPGCQFVSVTFSSYQAVSLFHSCLIILTCCLFDSHLYVHVTRPSV